MITVMKFTLVLLLCCVSASCVWQDTTRPSNLLIAVEGLSVDLIPCDQEPRDTMSGFQIICEEAVRFTHAFSPSTMSQASLASVLTGLYPHEHNVRDNGTSFLSESVKTVTEVAVERGYRTSLFSGGPPIWRKGGLDQGFELFDDNLIISLRKIFRPVGETVRLFNTWLRQDVGRQSFFSLLHIADLQFPYWPTVNELGMERELGPRGQLEELDESLHGLFQYLKATGRWRNMNIFLFGLNGRTTELRNDINAVDLFSSNMQVAMFVKPARQDRHQATAWTIDSNVSLVDIGATLYDVLGYPEMNGHQRSPWEAISLRSVFEKAQIDWEKDRIVLSESSWPVWRGVSTRRVAARQGHMLFIHDNEPLVYNTLIDRLEQQRIPARDVIVRVWAQEMLRLFSTMKIPPWEGIPTPLFDKLRWVERVDSWDSLGDHMKIRLRQLLKVRNWDRQIAGWAASIAITENNWSDLQKLGEEFSESAWVGVSQLNLGVKTDLGDDPCLRHLLTSGDLSPSETSCDDNEFLALVKWIRTGIEDKSYAEDRFVRIFAEKELDELIALHNLRNSLKWDTTLELPAGPRRSELVLALPEYQKYKKTLARRLSKF